jgi:hypothetical protein
MTATTLNNPPSDNIFDGAKPHANDASGKLFDRLIESHGLKNDAALSRLLGVQAPIISKVRHGKLPISAETLLIVYRKTKEAGKPLSIEQIEELIAS